MRITTARPGDADAIYALGRGVSEFEVGKGTVLFWPLKVVERAIAAEDAIVVTARDDDELVGLVIANYNRSLSKVLIENVYVSPEFRSRGIGSKMLAELLRTAALHGYGYVATLIPDEPETPALYESAGVSARIYSVGSIDHCPISSSVSYWLRLVLT